MNSTKIMFRRYISIFKNTMDIIISRINYDKNMI